MKFSDVKGGDASEAVSWECAVIDGDEISPRRWELSDSGHSRERRCSR